jgi:putative colanic acid biosynthesis acetyltransferase WcaF
VCTKAECELTSKMSRTRLVPVDSPSLSDKFCRAIWQLVWLMMYRPSPRIFHFWRRGLLRLFGARIGDGVHPYPSSKVWAPWNLEMQDRSTLADYVDCYCVDKICIGRDVTVSQYSYLCTASHDYSTEAMTLVTAPIVIGDRVWVTADCFIGPGVMIGKGAVVTARSSVFSDIDEWTVVSGNPAQKTKTRRWSKPDNRDEAE